MLQAEQNLETADKQLIQDYSTKLDQSRRNVNQGILGRQLAENKINEVKASMELISSNLARQAGNVKAEIDHQAEGKMSNLAQAQKFSKMVQATSNKVSGDVEGLIQVEKEMLDEGQDEF